MTKVVAVVLSWNGREDTLACLRSLEGENVEVIVVDNASEDGTAEAVEGAEVIRNERNLGYAGGMNVGIRRALERGEFRLVYQPVIDAGGGVSEGFEEVGFAGAGWAAQDEVLVAVDPLEGGQRALCRCGDR